MSETLAPAPPNTYGELSPPYGEQQLLPTSLELHHQQLEQIAQDLGVTALSTALGGEQVTGDHAEQLPQTESSLLATQSLDRLEAQPFETEGPYPKETIVGDGGHIEGQQLSFIKTQTGTQLTFKLTASAYDRFTGSQDMPLVSGTHRISYVAGIMSGWDMEREITTTTADVFHINGLEIMVAQRDSNWRALDGLVNINFPEQNEDGRPIDNDELGRRADATMRDLFGVKDAFSTPEALDEMEYKVNRYTWHHCIEDGQETYVPINKLVRQEVYPGYSTIVEPGKSEEYERKHGEIALFHIVQSDEVLPKVFKNGLMATHERFRRGLKHVGMSSENDLVSGGADSVFVHTVTEKSLKGGKDDAITYDRTMLVIKPVLMDRTDWYAYTEDYYGTTDPAVFDGRLTPDGLLERIGELGRSGVAKNEQMFRTGIPVEAIAGVSVGSPEHRKKLIASLLEAGITEVNDTPVGDFVQTVGCLSQIIDVAHGRSPREYKPPKIANVEF